VVFFQSDLSLLFRDLKIDNKYVSVFETNEIDLESVLLLSEDELKDLIPAIGPRLKLLQFIRKVLNAHLEIIFTR
jgi:hypothetical protein